jgi:sigma-B regulation protein RsbU (phosphoserine phosphatase)
MKYEDASLPIVPKMTLLLMTDGLPEQRSECEFYEDRLRRLIPGLYHLAPADMIQGIHEDFTDFVKYEKIKDDNTLVAAKLSESLT